MSNIPAPQTFADTILVPCPACKGSGEVIMRIQYTDRRKPCTMQPRTCIICNGTKKVTAAVDAEFAHKNHTPERSCP